MAQIGLPQRVISHAAIAINDGVRLGERTGKLGYSSFELNRQLAHRYHVPVVMMINRSGIAAHLRSADAALLLRLSCRISLALRMGILAGVVDVRFFVRSPCAPRLGSLFGGTGAVAAAHHRVRRVRSGVEQMAQPKQVCTHSRGCAEQLRLIHTMLGRAIGMCMPLVPRDDLAHTLTSHAQHH